MLCHGGNEVVCQSNQSQVGNQEVFKYNAKNVLKNCNGVLPDNIMGWYVTIMAGNVLITVMVFSPTI